MSVWELERNHRSSRAEVLEIKKAKNHVTKKREKTKWDNKNTDELSRAFLSLKTAAEIKAFLRDLLTEPELVEFGNRLYAAKMLSKDVHYNAIAEETGLSSRTIARVQNWRKRGMGGYRTVLARLKK